ncbi:hypothetical protein BJ742DRAFT_360077 [Cladochytrium replicatum]|nr:hypothetical protein BJ742DRAFT_360077 [Cladochytrium replicatum]
MERGEQPSGILSDDRQYLYKGVFRQPNTSMEFVRRVLNAADPRLRIWNTNPSQGPRFEEFVSPGLLLFNETTSFRDATPSLLLGGATNADEYDDGLLRTVEGYPALFSQVDSVPSLFSTRQREFNGTALALPTECLPHANPPAFTFHSYAIKQSSPARFYLTAPPETSVGQAFLFGPPFFTRFSFSNLSAYGLPVKCLEFSKNYPVSITRRIVLFKSQSAP